MHCLEYCDSLNIQRTTLKSINSKATNMSREQQHNPWLHGNPQICLQNWSFLFFFFFFKMPPNSDYYHHCCTDTSLSGWGVFVSRWGAATSIQSVLSQAAKCRAPLTRQTKSGARWWLMSVSSSLTAAFPFTQRLKKKQKKKNCLKKAAAESQQFWQKLTQRQQNQWQCAVGEASKTRDNSAFCLVISLAECAPSEVATLGATNGRRKRRAVKAVEIDVLLDAPRRENWGKTRQKWHV